MKKTLAWVNAHPLASTILGFNLGVAAGLLYALFI